MPKILRWNPKLNAAKESKDLSNKPTHLNGEGEGEEEEENGFFGNLPIVDKEAEAEEDFMMDDFPDEPVVEESAVIDEGISTDEPDFEGELPDGATLDDEAFMQDMASIITDDQGNEFMVDELVVVQNPVTKEVSLFMPSDVDESIPEDVEVIGKVVSANNESSLDSSRRVKSNCGSRRASAESNRIRNLKTDLKQVGAASVIKDIKQDGKPAIWFKKELRGEPYVFIVVPNETSVSVFHATGKEDTQQLLDKAASSYPTTYKNVSEFLDKF